MSIFRGLKITAAGTMLSRVLGMIRDMLTAYRFGASATMDALVLALRVPDLFRRMFGEGVLGASLIPIFSQRLKDREEAWKFLSAAMLATTLIPLGVVAVGEAYCGWQCGWQWEQTPLSTDLTDPTSSQATDRLLATKLTALLLPYVVLVCLLAQLAAALHALNRFTAPSLVSCVLNLGWIAACWFAPHWSDQQSEQAKFLALGVLASGILQVTWLFVDLTRQGWRPLWPNADAWRGARRSAAALLPAGIAISSTQINTTIDGLAAWWLSHDGALSIGAASAIYFGERMFMLPVGVVGIATAVVLYPTLCQMADARKLDEMARHVHQALRGMWLLAIPSSVGLALLAPPVVTLLLQRGEFTAEDGQRAAWVAASYGAGIWAFAVLPLLARVELALQRPWTAATAGLATIAANGVTAVWIGRLGGEWTLAFTTSALAVLQLAWLLFSVRRSVPIAWKAIAPSLLRSCLAALIMGGWILCARNQWLNADAQETTGRWALLATLLAVIGVGAAIHLGCERLLRKVIFDSDSRRPRGR